MKMPIYLFGTTLLLLTAHSASAHCPSRLKEEKVCFMLEDNLVYIYDQKLEHNGPYKNLEKASIVGFKSDQEKELAFEKIARGIYKLSAKNPSDPQKKYPSITIEIVVDKVKKEIKLKHE